MGDQEYTEGISQETAEEVHRLREAGATFAPTRHFSGLGTLQTGEMVVTLVLHDDYKQTEDVESGKLPQTIEVLIPLEVVEPVIEHLAACKIAAQGDIRPGKWS